MSRSQDLDLQEYETDKVESQYLDAYDQILGPWLDREIFLLELGVKQGGSLLYWRDYFLLGRITGIDLHIPPDFGPEERIEVFEGNQADTTFLTNVAEKVAPDGFDIIIDDASHIAELTKISFWHLFEHHLKPGGLYVIEDWGTGYWSEWPDGKNFRSRPPFLYRLWSTIVNKVWRLPGLPIKIPYSGHNYGMVGFVKELVDEQGAADSSRQSVKQAPLRKSKFESMTIRQGLVFIFKSSDN